MPVRFLSDAELARLMGWPCEIAYNDLVTFFTLTDDDLGWLSSNYRYENRLGAPVQLWGGGNSRATSTVSAFSLLNGPGRLLACGQRFDRRGSSGAAGARPCLARRLAAA